MTTAMRTLVIPVKDLDAAKRLYGTLLGTDPAVDMPYYVGFETPDLHLGLDPGGHGGVGAPVAYWHVADIAAARDELVGAGASIEQDAADVGGGRLRAVLRDADGNLVGLIQDPETAA